MKKIHYLSGIVLAVFSGMHLFNHGMSLWGEDVHIRTMENLRLVYRNPLVETLLLLAVAIQIVTGIRFFLQRRKLKLTGFKKIQLYSGLYLAFFLLVHVSAVFAGRFILHLDTNLYFGAAGLNSFPANVYFIPYYSLAIVSVFSHLAAVHSMKMKRSLASYSPHQQARAIIVLGLLTVLLVFYGLTDGFTGMNIPDAYLILTGKKL